MITKVVVRDKSISVQLEQYIVRITTDNQLTGLLQHNAKAATGELVIKIKAEYKNRFGTALQVSSKSMAIEIWGHVYADRFAVWMKQRIYFPFVQKATRFVIFHAETIDIGERAHDSNRFVWDALVAFEPMIALFLPK